MTSSFSSKLRGLESNQRPPDSESGVTTNSNYPARLNLECGWRNYQVSIPRSTFAIPHSKKAATGGFEPPTISLTGSRSAVELHGNVWSTKKGLMLATPDLCEFEIRKSERKQAIQSLGIQLLRPLAIRIARIARIEARNAQRIFNATG